MVDEEKNDEASGPALPEDVGRRVVHLTTVHRPFDPRIFYKQLVSLAEAGFDAHLIAPHHKIERAKGVTIHPLPRTENRMQRFTIQPKLWRKARDLGADLYQIHDPELIPLAYLLKKRTDARVIYDMHEDYRSKGSVLGRGLRAFERWCFDWVDHVLFAEESYRSILESNSGSHTHVANYFKPIGEDGSPEAVGGEPLSTEPIRLLYTGTVADKRGLRTMVDLAAELRAAGREETLTIVGICRHSDQRAAAEERIREEGLASVIECVGWDAYVPPSTMPSYYRQSDVGLALCEPHPNLVDSLLTKFFEYLHYGLPIICSDFPLWREFIEENRCGVVVPPGDPDAVLDVLEAWHEHPDTYVEHARNARAAASNYKWDAMKPRLLRVYRNLLTDPGE